MKKTISFALVLCGICCFSAGRAFADPYDYFTDVLNLRHMYNDKQGAQRLLDIFATDVGQAIAGGAYGVGGNIGIEGVSLSIKMSYQQIPTSNTIIRLSGSDALYYPILQADIDVNEDLGAIGRISYMYSSFLIGGGLRYRIYDGNNSDEWYIPTVGVQSIFNYLTMDDGRSKFDAWNLKTSPTAFFGKIPYMQPYVFLSYDVTSLTAKSSYFSGMNSSLNGFGYGMGLSLKVGTINLSGSISMYDGRPNYNFGVFVGI
ncbi:MAG: hypothetical protein FWC57_03615 [Endomicrobia bacterium]|nr:hypothetical protein [Endomicrobiia bacterium]